MMPKDHDGLIEWIARAMCRESEKDADDDAGYEGFPCGYPWWTTFVDCAADLLSAMEDAGLQVVPMMATVEMVAATKKCDMRKQGRFYDVWSAMLSASPFAPKKHET